MLQMRAITVASVITLITAYLLESVALAVVSCALLGVMFLKKGSGNRSVAVNTEDATPPLLIKAQQDFRKIEAARSRLKETID